MLVLLLRDLARVERRGDEYMVAAADEGAAYADLRVAPSAADLPLPLPRVVLVDVREAGVTLLADGGLLLEVAVADVTGCEVDVFSLSELAR